MKMNNKLKLTGLAGIIALSTGCAIGPNRITQNDVRNFKGSIAEYSSMYSENMGALDAAQTNRESRCFEDFAGKTYKTEKDLFNNLSSCVASKRKEDILKYGTIATIADGLKVFLLFKGFQGPKTTYGKNTNTFGNGSVNRIITTGTN